MRQWKILWALSSVCQYMVKKGISKIEQPTFSAIKERSMQVSHEVCIGTDSHTIHVGKHCRTMLHLELCAYKLLPYLHTNISVFLFLSPSPPLSLSPSHPLSLSSLSETNRGRETNKCLCVSCMCLLCLCVSYMCVSCVVCPLYVSHTRVSFVCVLYVYPMCVPVCIMWECIVRVYHVCVSCVSPVSVPCVSLLFVSPVCAMCV